MNKHTRLAVGIPRIGSGASDRGNCQLFGKTSPKSLPALRTVLLTRERIPTAMLGL